MTATQSEIRPGAYYDSVVLMQLQKALAALPGIHDAGVVMATQANLSLLSASGFPLAGIQAEADDLLIIVRAQSDQEATEAIGQVDALLKLRQTSSTGAYRPRSLKAGVSMLTDAHCVLVSVPGRYAADVAEEALSLGKHVFLYSDNVPLADEVRLKAVARGKGLLVMGPDCGTAIINGVGLGFANRVRTGDIGLVAAAGTGLQAVSSEIHRLGSGISQAIGTGGRDLKAEVGGVTSAQGLELLGRDPETRVIVLVSKPPSAEVAAGLLRSAAHVGKPVVVSFIGYAPPARRIGNVHFAAGLSDAARLAADLNQEAAAEPSEKGAPLTGYLRGLFSGGTLAVQTLLGLQPVLAPLYSNLSTSPEWALPDLTVSLAHTILDLGEDAFTQGRLHPMLDNDLRLRRLRQEATDPDVDLILLDVVLGDGAHPDPAAEFAPAVAEAASAGKRLVAVLIGTDEDVQEAREQAKRLAVAGAVVCRSVDEALAYVWARLPQPDPIEIQVPLSGFSGSGLKAINVGLESFYDSLTAQGADAIHVDWRPPAGGNEQLMAILARMRRSGGSGGAGVRGRGRFEIGD